VSDNGAQMHIPATERAINHATRGHVSSSSYRLRSISRGELAFTST